MEDQLSQLLGASITSGGGGGLLVWFIFKSKFDGVAKLHSRFDEFQKDIAEQRLADAKEYATRAEVAHAIKNLEDHIDQRLQSLESKIDTMLRSQ